MSVSTRLLVIGLAMVSFIAAAAAVPVFAQADSAVSLVPQKDGSGLRLHASGDPGSSEVTLTKGFQDDPRPEFKYVWIDHSGVVPGAGCRAVTPTRAACEWDGYQDPFTLVRLGGGNDTMAFHTLYFDRLKVFGGGGADYIHALGVRRSNTVIRVNGGAGGDTLIGDADSDLLFGNAGSDLVRGKGGDDRLYGGTGSDAIFGGGATDILHAEDGMGDRVIHCGMSESPGDMALVDKRDDPPDHDCEMYAVVHQHEQ